MTDETWLIALWEAGKHPREWTWLRVRTDEIRTAQMVEAAEGQHLVTTTWRPTRWMLAREHDGVEAEVYVPC